MFEWVASPEAWLALVTLTALEIVLGIDNIIFLSIVVGRLPEAQRNRARIQGLALAMITRILLLLSLAWMMRLTEPLFVVMPGVAATLTDSPWRDALAVSGRDLILILGGLFLLWKSAQEIYDSLEGSEETGEIRVPSKYWMVLRSDRDHRHRLLARLRDHGGGHGQARTGDGAGHRRRGGRNDVCRQVDRRFRGRATRASRCWP